MPTIRKRIMVVDDNKASLTYLTLLLRKMGFVKLTIAESLMEAMRLLKMMPADIIILVAGARPDDASPFIRSIKADHELGRTSVLVIMPEGSSPDADVFPGAEAVLAKPLKLRALNNAIQNCIEQSGINRRRHLRAKYERTVRVSHSGGEEHMKAMNLSEGGTFLVRTEPLEVGESVTVHIEIPDRCLSLIGKVIYHKSVPARTPLKGMAVEFEGLDEGNAKALSAYVVELINPAMPVTCAIIEHEGRVLAARRGKGMDREGMWEFPGGKLREGEAHDKGIVREIMEELALEVRPVRELAHSVHQYGDRRIRLIPIVCELVGGELTLHEHSEARWVEPGALATLEWCPADVPVVEGYAGGR